MAASPNTNFASSPIASCRLANNSAHGGLTKCKLPTAGSLLVRGTASLLIVASTKCKCEVVAMTESLLTSPSSKGFYRRPLPSLAIGLYSLEGEKLFNEARQQGTAANFLPLISYYNTQSEPKFCGPASLSMVLNALDALEIDPGRIWKGNWRWIDESMLVSEEELAKIKKEGISLGKAASVAHSNGAKVWVYWANQININIFRSFISFCTSVNNLHVILSYDRKGLEQSGAGHLSPIGAYHAGKDMVLVLDVARYKYPPHWVPLNRLWDSMNTIVKSTKTHRGFMIVSRDQSYMESSMLYSKIYGHKGWNMLLIYMIKDFPLLLDAAYVTDVQKVLSVAFDTSIVLRVLIPWVAEVGSHGHVLKEDLLMEIRETKLFSYVSTWLETKVGNGLPSINLEPNQNCYIGMHHSTGDVLALLLFGMPQVTWSHIKEKNLRQEITSLVSVYKHPLLQEEVLHLRRELEFLIIDLLSSSILKSE